ncbi:Crp/Fnr family transcriptional regulator [Mycolicibacterium sp. P9-64]|uniref:Crp/Fnr family transcriptional regulator n=1 Tax=Mycolicibacterium sp. P9-64 TaxID=2024612 RepID=UPI0011ED4BE0|nr:Crp/Fnr family transcriptional regulator [Mycolicibacterium sp. P9-64]KAA0086992.1 Crp/Fnr family transcriptional regulator [Mycolicibacterium sp. P9-64]
MKPFLSSADLDMTRFFDGARPVTFAPGAWIADVELLKDNAFLITAGVIRISILTSDGRERLLFYGSAGSIIGDYITFGDLAHVPLGTQVHAISAVEALRLPQARLRAACAQEPEVLLALLSWAYGKIAALIEQLESATFRDTTAQVAALLEAFDAESRRARDSRTLLDLTHQQIASATGRTRVSVTYALNKLQQAGVIALKRGHVDVLDPMWLARIATEGLEGQ